MDNTGITLKKQDEFYDLSVPLQIKGIGRFKKKPQSAGCLILDKIYPFRFAMITALQRRGIYVQGMQFKTLVATFYNEFSGKKTDLVSFINNPAFKIGLEDELTVDLSSVRNQTSMIEVSLIVDSIVNIFKTAKQKYQVALDYGYEPDKILSDEDLIFAKAARIVENDLLRKFKADHFLKAGEVSSATKWILGFVIVLYLLYIWD